MDLLYYCNFIIPFGKILYPMHKAECLHLVMYFSAEYHYSEQNILLLFWKYLGDPGSEVWQIFLKNT